MRKLFDLDDAEFDGPKIDSSNDGSLSTGNGYISGMGVAEDVDAEVNSANLEDLLTSNERSEEEIAREQAERDAYEQAENEKNQAIEDRYNRERYEREQAEKAKRLAEEKARQEEEEEEAREEFEQTFVGKLTKLFRKKQISSKEEEQEEIHIAASYTGEEEEALPEPEITEEEAVPVLAQTKDEPEVEEISVAMAEKTESEVEETSEENSDAVMPASINAIDLLNGSATLEEVKEVSEIKKEKEEAKKPIKEESKEIPTKVEKPKETKEIKAPKAKPEVKKAEKAKKTEKKLSIFGKLGNVVSSTKTNEKKSSGKTDGNASTAFENISETDWKYIATHDETTGLGNVRAFKMAKEKAGLNLAVLFFDVNNLKYVNDNYGHADGDLLLKRTADLIAEHFGKDNSFRTGGDEFVSILPNSNSKKAQEELGVKVGEIHKAMQNYMKKSENHVPHSVSVGLAVGDGKHSVDDVVKAADTAMYRNKKAYKDSHPEFNARTAKKEELPKAEEKDHDDLLSKQQKDLKTKIKSQHTQPSQMSTTTIIREIQRRAGDVHAIFIASPNFDYLYIIRDVEEFVNMALEQSQQIDYSYLYVVWDGGPQYYGADTYYNEVTDLFKEIAEGLMSGKFRSEKDIKSIKGLNIFRSVYI